MRQISSEYVAKTSDLVSVNKLQDPHLHFQCSNWTSCSSSACVSSTFYSPKCKVLTSLTMSFLHLRYLLQSNDHFLKGRRNLNSFHGREPSEMYDFPGSWWKSRTSFPGRPRYKKRNLDLNDGSLISQNKKHLILGS